MKLKCHFETVELEDEMIGVPVGKEAKSVSGVIKMNKSGQEILDLLSQGQSPEGIVNCLSKKYDNDRHELTEYVLKVINDLNTSDLLEKD